MQNKNVKVEVEDNMKGVKLIQVKLIEHSGNTATKFEEVRRCDGKDMDTNDIYKTYQYMKKKYNTDEIAIIGKAHIWLTFKTYEGHIDYNIGETYARQASQQNIDPSLFSKFQIVKFGLKIFDTNLYKKERKIFLENLRKKNK